jgi:hypothetical protein
MAVATRHEHPHVSISSHYSWLMPWLQWGGWEHECIVQHRKPQPIAISNSIEKIEILFYMAVLQVMKYPHVSISRNYDLRYNLVGLRVWMHSAAPKLQPIKDKHYWEKSKFCLYGSGYVMKFHVSISKYYYDLCYNLGLRVWMHSAALELQFIAISTEKIEILFIIWQYAYVSWNIPMCPHLRQLPWL